MAENKKPDIELLETCDYAVISQDNKLSILGIFDQIVINTSPSNHSKMFVVAVIRGQPNSKHTFEISIKDPTGKNVLPEMKLEPTIGPNGKTNILAELANLPIPVQGEYKVKLSSLGVLLGTRSFNVIKTGISNAGAKRSSKYSN